MLELCVSQYAKMLFEQGVVEEGDEAVRVRPSNNCDAGLGSAPPCCS